MWACNSSEVHYQWHEELRANPRAVFKQMSVDPQRVKCQTFPSDCPPRHATIHVSQCCHLIRHAPAAVCTPSPPLMHRRHRSTLGGASVRRVPLRCFSLFCSDGDSSSRAETSDNETAHASLLPRRLRPTPDLLNIALVFIIGYVASLTSSIIEDGVRSVEFSTFYILS